MLSWWGNNGACHSEEPLYPFGFGLSYSEFEFSEIQLDKTNLALGDSPNVSLTLTNLGASDSAEVAQFYLSDIHASTVIRSIISSASSEST
jgi:beta-glucosidase